MKGFVCAEDSSDIPGYQRAKTPYVVRRFHTREELMAMPRGLAWRLPTVLVAEVSAEKFARLGLVEGDEVKVTPHGLFGPSISTGKPRKNWWDALGIQANPETGEWVASSSEPETLLRCVGGRPGALAGIHPPFLGGMVAIVGGSESRKSTVLEETARALVVTPNMVPMYVALDERTYEILRDAPPGFEVWAAPSRLPAKIIKKYADLVYLVAQQRALAGRDVVLFLDSLFRLAVLDQVIRDRTPGEGLTSGGVSSVALLEFSNTRLAITGQVPNNGGSLTLVATWLLEESNRMSQVLMENCKSRISTRWTLQPGYAGAPPRVEFVGSDYSSSSRHLERVKSLSHDDVDRIWALQRAMHDREGVHLKHLMLERLDEERRRNPRLQFLDRDTVAFLKEDAAGLVQQDFDRLIEAANTGATYEELWQNWPEILDGKWIEPAQLQAQAEPVVEIPSEPVLAEVPAEPAARPTPTPAPAVSAPAEELPIIATGGGVVVRQRKGKPVPIAVPKQPTQLRQAKPWGNIPQGWWPMSAPVSRVEVAPVVVPEPTPQVEVAPPAGGVLQSAPVLITAPVAIQAEEMEAPADGEGRPKKPKPQVVPVPALSGSELDKAAADLLQHFGAPLEEPTHDEKVS